ncbi:MAG: hypothetical protein HWQ35_31545 [Nostoc sp. NMS1]|uniref:hypothetical protein n=1 Tax=unclassified Nostoc TaxID=2593658 RepID=UPI0025E921FC|nr:MULTISPECIES: hypothetical protein [unclassified Nostoc]MBN3910910.1 hypothetical protein [Nostoc sp. NMS1]MBN3993051.1 hypothetical protein [Nostoc sp. NMS2]
MKGLNRKGSDHENAVNHPRSPQKEPTSSHELKQLLMTVRIQRDEWQQRAKENEEAASQRDEAEQRANEAASQLVHVQQEIQTYQIEANELKLEANELKERFTQNYLFYIDEQENHQKTLYLYNEEKAKISQLVHVHQREIQTCQLEANELKEKVTQNYRFYIDEQQSHQQTLCLYNEEKTKATELLTKYDAANSEREMYLTLYNEAKAELKHERRSKASIKGWETRRKAENERLKREIAQMVVLLRESLESKDEAVNSLYVVAERMDRIQSLVDSVEEETTNSPMGLVQKFKRIWLAIKDILSE